MSVRCRRLVELEGQEISYMRDEEKEESTMGDAGGGRFKWWGCGAGQ